MIRVSHVSKQFDKTIAVKDVSLEVAEGETLAILGTSGSGKTTLLRMLNRLIDPGSGEIFINNKNIATEAPETLRRSIGYVLQGYGLFPHYTVAENIAIVPKLLHWPAATIKNRTRELMQKLQLPPDQYSNAYPATLSGGQKQRVGLARALAADPPILLMDEPFGALDPLTKAEVKRSFKELDELKKKTIILVTHDVTEAFELGSRIALMNKGVLLQTGTAAELLFKPNNNFVRSFLEQQKLQLTLQHFTLQSVWQQLPDANLHNENFLHPQQSLWQAMEMLALTGKEVYIKPGDNPTGKTIGFAEIGRVLQNSNQR